MARKDPVRRGTLARLAIAAAYCWWAALPAFATGDVSAEVGPASLVACAACHGPQLQGDRAFDAPNLSVLGAWYVERQLRLYRLGRRAPPGSANLPGRQMQPLAVVLDEPGIARAAGLVQSVPQRPALPTVQGDPARGALLYRTCSVCHGERGEGNQALNAPRLAGQNDWYLVRQLRNYKAGLRGVYGDMWSAQMRAATGVLADDAAIVDVVAHVNGLGQ